VNWRIEYAKSVQKTAAKLDPPVRKRIKHFLEQRLRGRDDPRQLGKALKVGQPELWRYRVGDYRIICVLHDETLIVLVVRIGHRKDVYR
jgi:mRNA interferase RelE/StbE